jgi:dTDP-4-dehydrorhamnose 3,5-epimerase
VELTETGIPGCFVVRPHVIADARGRFVKIDHAPTLAGLGLRGDWREEYQSSSARDVVRGMHFQVPPADHAKLVYCLAGEVLDVILDLRRGSPTFAQHRSVLLDGESSTGIYVPTGCAHGFLSRSDGSLMLYKVTSVHAPDQDRGIAWNSFGYDWPVEAPLLSPRDQAHPGFPDFETPFRFDPEQPAR